MKRKRNICTIGKSLKRVRKLPGRADPRRVQLPHLFPYPGRIAAYTPCRVWDRVVSAQSVGGACGSVDLEFGGRCGSDDDCHAARG